MQKNRGQLQYKYLPIKVLFKLFFAEVPSYTYLMVTENSTPQFAGLNDDLKYVERDNNLSDEGLHS